MGKSDPLPSFSNLDSGRNITHPWIFFFFTLVNSCLIIKSHISASLSNEFEDTFKPYVVNFSKSEPVCLIVFI